MIVIWIIIIVVSIDVIFIEGIVYVMIFVSWCKYVEMCCIVIDKFMFIIYV